MSQWRPSEVWTERESGDWEACVATAYAMGLLYGGAWMPAPYTQAERERLELVPDEPQDLPSTDGKALTVYGAKLRPPSVTTSREAFLARPGLGFCLTGAGSPVGYGTGFTHEIFAIALSTTTLRIYDPLTPAGGSPVDRPISTIAGWLNGIAAHQAREIAENELGEAMSETIVTLTKYPEGLREWYAAGGLTTGYLPDGSTKQLTLAAGSWAHTDGTAHISQDPQKAPNGSGFVHIVDGAFEGYYLVPTAGTVPVPEPPPDGGYDDGFAAGALAQQQAWEGWLAARPVGELEAWAGQHPNSPLAPVPGRDTPRLDDDARPLASS